MNRLFCLLALGVLTLMSSPVHAAIARSYPDALRRAKDKPIVAFIYGANYDKVSLEARERFVKRRAVTRVARNCIFIEIPVYQMPDKKEQRIIDRVMGDAKLPGGIWSYPCFAVIDSSGTLRGIVQSGDELKSAETAAAALNDILKRFREQQKIVRSAERAKGTKMAEKICEALDLDLKLSKDLIKRAADADAGNKGGYRNRLNFSYEDLLSELSEKGGPQAEAIVRGNFSRTNYGKKERQESLAVLTGHLRRNGASAERLKALYYEMRNIDPDSIYGGYAMGALELWCDESFEEEAFKKEAKTIDLESITEGGPEDDDDEADDDSDSFEDSSDDEPSTPETSVDYDFSEQG